MVKFRRSPSSSSTSAFLGQKRAVFDSDSTVSLVRVIHTKIRGNDRVKLLDVTQSSFKYNAHDSG
nr:unnamed protein product [Callosobruchus analis]